MTKYLNVKLARVFTLLSTVVFALFLLGQTFVFAGGPTPPAITAVSPNTATQGDNGVVVRIDISNIPPPSPNFVMIGAESGSNLQKDSSAVTATFDFPPGLTPALYDVVVEFPGPGDPVTVTAVLTNGFEILQANCLTTYGAHTSTQFASNDATAVQAAVDAASVTDVVKIAGDCTGVSSRNNVTQTAYLDKDITLQGGHTQTNWTAMPDASTYPTTLDANDLGRVVHISGTHAITIAYLTLQNGYAAGTDNGGALFNDDSVVTIENSVLKASRASDGGGIFNDSGTINLKDSTLSNNRADANTLSEARGGGAVFNNDNAHLIVTGSQIVTNTTEGSGGGIFNSGNLTVTQSLVANNIGSALQPREVARIAAPQYLSDMGGGIANLYGDAWINNSTIRDNIIAGIGGGGIAHSGGDHYVTIANSTIEGNNAIGGQGGGILFSRNVTVTNSTVSGNSADIGGGIQQSTDETATAVIEYSTIVSNTASINGNNLSTSSEGGVIELSASIVSGAGDNCYFPQGQLVDNGYNLESAANCGLTKTTSLTNTNPLLYALADNGGDTETHAIDITSPAVNKIGAGSLGCGSTVVSDQRGAVRPDDKQCDIGAYELISSCETTYGAHSSTQFSSVDATAVQNAIDAATAGDMVKISGDCKGVQNQNGTNQTVYIDKNITLQGGYLAGNWMATPNPVAYPTTLDADENGRVVFITGTNTISISNLIIQNGLMAGTADGGGIYNDGSTVSIGNSTLTANEASDGGAIYNTSGGILNISVSVIRHNRANATGAGGSSTQGGGGIYNDDGYVTISNSQILTNSSGFNGGGIVNSGFPGDTALLTVTQSLISGNTVDTSAGRGGTRVATPDNASEIGGGIANFWGDTIIQNSTIRYNSVTGTGGGGIAHTANGNLTIANSTINNNLANGGQGGALYYTKDVTITNSTISNNSAESGGGLFRAHDGNTMIQFSTIISNTANLNGNDLAVEGPQGDFVLGSSIIAGSNNSCYFNNNAIVDNGYNLESGDSCGLTISTSITNTDPLLLPLADNGGDTETYALADNSPALNQISNGANGCGTTYTTDQRGETRPFANLCDIGAFELQDATYTIYLPIILKQD